MTKLSIVDGDGKGRCGWLVFFVIYFVSCRLWNAMFYSNLVFQWPLVVFLCLLFFMWNFVWCGWGYTIYLVDIN